MKFSDVPVSPYTGTADVNIPIYTVQARGISVPVALDYHTGGIRLKEESGWVGLGWSLTAGGMISRTIMGLDDFGGEYFNTPVPDITGNLVTQPTIIQPYGSGNASNSLGLMGYDFFCNYNVYTDQGTKDFSSALQTSNPFDDLEPDIYSYNFLGRSGKFIINRSGKVIIQKQENIVVQYATNGSSFTIIDDQGNKFYFQTLEYTKPLNGNVSAISSWMLSMVVSQLNDTVRFNYVSDNTWTNVAGDPYEIFRYGCPPNNQETAGISIPNTYWNITLQNIDFANGQLQFSFDNNREDLLNGKKLNGIKIYSKNAAGTLTYVKEHQFFYSFFNKGLSSGTPLEFERLRLDSVKEVSGLSSIPPYSFIYNLPNQSYVQLTAKHAYNVDHWGYYSGYANSASQFTPDFNGLYNVPISGGGSQGLILSLTGANREPDSASMRAFSLQQVNYPTGGSTSFQYEPNFYDIQNSTIGTQDFPQMYLVDTTISFSVSARGISTGTIDLSNIWETNVPNPNIVFSVAFRSATTANQPVYRNQSGKIYFAFNGINVDMSQTTLNCNGPVCTTGSTEFEVNAPGVYTWTAKIDSSIGSDFEGIYLSFSWQEQAINHYKSTTWMAGGLRLKSVTDYSSAGVVAKMRRYDYTYLANKYGWGTKPYQYGKLMSFPSYARIEPLNMNNQEINGYCQSLTRTSSSNTAITSVIQGNIVGYDQVAEYTIDPVSGIDIGKTVYMYFNSPDTPIYYQGYRLPGLLNFGNNLNGLLISKIAYVNNGGNYYQVSETDNSYHTTNRVAYLNMKYYYTPTTGGPGSGCPVAPVANQFLAFFYPSIKSERVLLDQTKETIYDQNDQTKAFSTTKAYYYDNPLHYQLTRAISNDSKSNTLTSIIKYPQDYIPNGNTITGNAIMDTMISKNMVSETIEKRDSLGYAGTTSGSTITGAQLSTFRQIATSSILPDKISRLDLTGPTNSFQPYSVNGNSTSQDSRFRQLISFDSYDNLNNINQYTTTDQTPVAFIWDYKSVYPVAQVKNAVLADIAFTSFEADGSGNWNISSSSRDSATIALTGICSYKLASGSISKTGLTSGKVYTLTYWSRNGSYSISGGSSTTRTGRSVNGWTYYEHTVTMTSSSVTISGSGNIDELRLYPQGSLMTSYSYNPLVGVISMNDPNSEITFYEYDVLTRLRNIKDYQGNILKNYQYNYGNSCGNNCSVLIMQNFAGTNTLGYPVGVFNTNGKLLGNASNQAAYVSIWNSDTADQHRGILADGLDSLHFNLTANTGAIVPSAVTGCRYYQVDLPWTQMDAVRAVNGCYVDFGDGINMRLGKNPMDTTGIILPANTTFHFATSSDPLAANFYIHSGPYYVHIYPDSSLKTLTFYHNDGTESPDFDCWTYPANSLFRIKNFRGNYPQNMQFLGGTSYQQSSANSVTGITNWNSINTITTWYPYGGFYANYIDPNRNMSYVQDFMQNNKNLTTIRTANGSYYTQGYSDTTFKLSKLKSNWTTYFTNLNAIAICEDHWNHEDLSVISNLIYFNLEGPNQNHSNSSAGNPLVPIPTSEVDNIFNQIASGSGQYLSNGTIIIQTGGPTYSSASSASVSFLKSKGWTIYISSVLQ